MQRRAEVRPTTVRAFVLLTFLTELTTNKCWARPPPVAQVEQRLPLGFLTELYTKADTALVSCNLLTIQRRVRLGPVMAATSFVVL